MREMFRGVSVSALFIAVVFLISISVWPVAAQEQEPEEAQENQLEDWERAELQGLVQTVGAALRGELTQDEKPFTLKPHFLKGADGMTYVPFTVTLDSDQISESAVAMYLFVTVHQDPSSAPVQPEENSEELPEVPQVPPAVFEDAYFIGVSDQRTAGDQIELSRAFTAAGGEYDVYVAVSDSLGGPLSEDQDASVVLMLKEQVVVPNLWTPELQTSTVLIANLIEPLTAPLSPIEQVQQPYTLGTTKIIPKHDRSFGKQDELSLIMLVYNPQLTSDQKPDLTIEYNFHQRTDDGEEFFNKTNPQQFNAQTLPPGFDVALGHQIVAGQAVPLSLFPAGEYRLEITISDNEAGTNLVRDVNFTVLET